MKDNASFSVLTDINYNSNSHEIVTDEFPNGLLKQYFTLIKMDFLMETVGNITKKAI